MAIDTSMRMAIILVHDSPKSSWMSWNITRLRAPFATRSAYSKCSDRLFLDLTRSIILMCDAQIYQTLIWDGGPQRNTNFLLIYSLIFVVLSVVFSFVILIWLNSWNENKLNIFMNNFFFFFRVKLNKVPYIILTNLWCFFFFYYCIICIYLRFGVKNILLHRFERIKSDHSLTNRAFINLQHDIIHTRVYAI